MTTSSSLHGETLSSLWGTKVLYSLEFVLQNYKRCSSKVGRFTYNLPVVRLQWNDVMMSVIYMHSIHFMWLGLCSVKMPDIWLVFRFLIIILISADDNLVIKRTHLILLLRNTLCILFESCWFCACVWLDHILSLIAERTNTIECMQM